MVPVVAVPATRLAVWREAISLLRDVGIARAAVRIGKASTPVTTGRAKTIGKASTPGTIGRGRTIGKASTLTATTTSSSAIGSSGMAYGSGPMVLITMPPTTAIGSVVKRSSPATPTGGTAITPVGITTKLRHG